MQKKAGIIGLGLIGGSIGLALREEGWEVISIATATIPGLTGAREEMIVVFEREK